MEPLLLDDVDTARLTKTKVSTARRLIRLGVIPSIQVAGGSKRKVRRVRASDLAKWVESQRAA